MHNKCSDEMNSSLQNNEFILMKNFNFLFLFIGNISRSHLRYCKAHSSENPPHQSMHSSSCTSTTHICYLTSEAD